MKKIYNFSLILCIVLALGIIKVNAGVNADSISVTLYCDLTGTANENASALYITGHFTLPGGNWTFKPMTLAQPNIWMVTIKYLPGSITGDTTSYYFATANDWSEPSREVVPAPCNRSWSLHRSFLFDIAKTDSAVAFKWGQCEAYKPSDILTGLKITEKNNIIVSTTSKGLVRVNIPSGTSKVNLELINLSGRIVRKIRSSSKEININVSDLNKGIYILKVSGNQITDLRKIIIK